MEITESIAMTDTSLAERIMKDLVERGIEISIDDFGTGYSSLAYLNKFPIHTVKIDKSFIAALPKSESVVKSVLALGKNLGFNVVAEGVETEAQRKMLFDEGCDFLQGYLLSKPLPKEKAIEFIRSLV